MGAVCEEAQSVLDRIKLLFRKDLLPEAFEALRALESDYPEHTTAVPEIEELRRDVERVNQSLQMLADFESWELVREEDDIAIFSKGSANEFFIRSEMLMNHSPFSLLAIFSEVDLLANWIDVVAESREVARPSVFRRVNHFTMKLPWPLSNRDMLLSCIGVAMPQNQSVLLSIGDIGSRTTYLGCEMPAPEQGIVRIALQHCCINIMQTETGQTQVSFLVRSDPKIALLPSAVRNWASKQATFMFMRAIRDQCARFPGSEYEKRVKNNPEYYDMLRQMASRYHFEHVE